MFTNKKREGINTFDCAVSFYVAATPKASIREPIIPFGIVAYGFCWTTFLEKAVDKNYRNKSITPTRM